MGGISNIIEPFVKSLMTNGTPQPYETYIMRTNILIDDSLMAEVLKVSGAKSKREAVELGLRTLLALKQQERIKQFKGQLKWEGDLEQLRT
jgi:Arc/MetJ family transcription regulator